MAAYCCQSLREAVALGEMVRDRFGRWKFPISFMARAFNEPPPRYSFTFCPFCGSLLPRDEAAPPAPPYEAAPDVSDDGN